MKRTTMFLTEELESDLQSLARRRGKPVAGLVREALVAYVAREKQVVRALPGFVAAGRSGRADTAERHEELLWRAPHGEPSDTSATRPATPAGRPRKRR
jgi:predicted transcriptional regulator